jgi:hypothetical protein
VGRAVGSVLTAVGYVVGSYFGYPQLGTFVGAMFGAALQPGIDGPGPGELVAPAIQLGSPIPRPYGRVRMSVSPISMPSEFRSIEHSSDGKGGPEGPSSYTFETDLLAIVADGTRVIAVTREWWNKKLIFTSLADSSADSLANSLTTDYYSSVTDYFGGSSQLPAPLYEDRVGTANALANRGMFTREYASVQCGSAKTLPQMEVEVITRGTLVGGNVFWLVNANDVGSSFSDTSSWGMNTDGVNLINGTPAAFGSSSGTNIALSNTQAGFFFDEINGSVPWTADDHLTLEARIRLTTAPTAGIAYLRSGAIANEAIAFGVNTTISPQTYTTYLRVFDQIATLGPFDDFPVETGAFFMAAVDYDGDTHTATGYINGAAVISLTYSGTPPTITQIDEGYAGYLEAGTYAADILQVDGVRFTRRLRWYPDPFTVPNVEPTADETWTPLPEMLSDVILAELALHPDFNASDVDVTDIDEIEVTGFLAVGPPASNIQQLCDMYYVDVVPGNPIKFVRRGRASVGEIAYQQTGVGSENHGALFGGLKQENDDEISGVKAISYPDLTRDHNPGFQRADRLTTDGPDVQRISTRVVMQPNEAKGRAITAALIARLRKQTAQFGISDKYAAAEPGDAYTVPDFEGNSYRLRIERMRYTDGVKECEWELDDPSALIASGAADLSGEPGIEVAAAGVALWEAMDLPQLRDADNFPGYYLASKTSDDSRAFGYESPDDTAYTEVQQFGLDAVFGTVSTVTGTMVAGNFFNQATLTVNVGDGELSSTTRAGVLNDRTRNVFAIATTAGVCRGVGQFVTATPVSSGVYTISAILWDRWENNRYVGDIAAGDVFCLLASAGGLARIARALAQLGLGHYVKVVAERRTPASVSGEAFTAEGVSLKPLAPVQLRRTTDASTGDSTYTFNRCTRSETRFGGDLGDACPLGESSEQYRIRFYTDGTYATVVRDLGTVTTAAFSYTGAQRTSDYGSTTAAGYVGITQVSALVGEGYPLQAAA